MASPETPISPITSRKPELTMTTTAINSEPVELESTPISPERLRSSQAGSKSAAEEAMSSSLSPEDQKLRDHLMQERKVDPAVMVDIPDLPDADQLAQADTVATGQADGETPGEDAAY